MRNSFGPLLAAVVVGACQVGQEPAQTDLVGPEASLQDGRRLLFSQYPELLPRIAAGGSFGGSWSRPAAVAMLSRDPAITEDVRQKTTRQKLTARTHLIRLPIVNAAVVETDSSLVLVDAGYASAGPVLVEHIKAISDKPVSHILISHMHLDHAWGTWAIKQAWPDAIIIGHERLPANLKLHITQAGRFARYNNQPISTYPTIEEELPLPDQVFDGALTLNVGGVEFQLFSAPAETDDQFYVFVPSERVLFNADYYQGFLPNAGNGKRMQRYIPEWSQALRHMASLDAQIMAPMHGPPTKDTAEIARVLTLHADALDYVVEHVWNGLNSGQRRDQIVASLDWPSKFSQAPELKAPYVRPSEIAKMEIRRWAGWWDDIPSHYYAPPMEREAEIVLELAGGLDALVAKARKTLSQDPQIAARLADWAVFARPGSIEANQLAVDVYLDRINDPDVPTQELLVYLDTAARARSRLQQLQSTPLQSVALTSAEIKRVFANVRDEAKLLDAPSTRATNHWYKDGTFQTEWRSENGDGMASGAWWVDANKRCTRIDKGPQTLVGNTNCGTILRRGAHFISLNEDGSEHGQHTLTPIIN